MRDLLATQNGSPSVSGNIVASNPSSELSSSQASPPSVASPPEIVNPVRQTNESEMQGFADQIRLSGAYNTIPAGIQQPIPGVSQRLAGRFQPTMASTPSNAQLPQPPLPRHLSDTTVNGKINMLLVVVIYNVVVSFFPWFRFLSQVNFFSDRFNFCILVFYQLFEKKSLILNWGCNRKIGKFFLIFHPLPYPLTNFYLPSINDPPLPTTLCPLLLPPYLTYTSTHFFLFLFPHFFNLVLAKNWTTDFGSVVLVHFHLITQETVASKPIFLGITSYWFQTDIKKIKLVWKKYNLV